MFHSKLVVNITNTFIFLWKNLRSSVCSVFNFKISILFMGSFPMVYLMTVFVIIMTLLRENLCCRRFMSWPGFIMCNKNIYCLRMDKQKYVLIVRKLFHYFILNVQFFQCNNRHLQKSVYTS